MKKILILSLVLCFKLQFFFENLNAEDLIEVNNLEEVVDTSKIQKVILNDGTAFKIEATEYGTLKLHPIYNHFPNKESFNKDYLLNSRFSNGNGSDGGGG